MKYCMIFVALASLSVSALANKAVYIKDGRVESVVSVYGKIAKVNHNKNQYTDAEWESFGITEEPPYIIKDGDVWRDMTQAEKDAVDEAVKQEALVEATEDVDMDALFEVIAEAVKNNLKTKDAIKAAFKDSVDPKKKKKKAKKKEK